MKQMRSRFRLITLVLACAFLLVLVLCTGRVLKETGFSLSSLPALPQSLVSATPDPVASPETISPSVSPDISPDADMTPVPPDSVPSESTLPETDNSPAPEYNLFGL